MEGYFYEERSEIHEKCKENTTNVFFTPLYFVHFFDETYKC